MQQISMAAADRRPFRRRATTLAVLLMLAGTAEAFDIPTGNPDLALRWDNTFRYNLGFRTQSQDPNILASPNFDDGDRNFSNGSIVTNRLDLLSEFDFIYQRKLRLPRQRRRLVRRRVRQSRQHEQRDSEHAGRMDCRSRAC